MSGFDRGISASLPDLKGKYHSTDRLTRIRVTAHVCRLTWEEEHLIVRFHRNQKP